MRHHAEATEAAKGAAEYFSRNSTVYGSSASTDATIGSKAMTSRRCRVVTALCTITQSCLSTVGVIVSAYTT